MPRHKINKQRNSLYTTMIPKQPYPYSHLRQHSSSQPGPDTIWSFWDGELPDLVHRCLESIKFCNPDKSVVVLNMDTMLDFLNEDDFPLVQGERVGPNDFQSIQYLADWVRLTLLEKYGGVWFDASVICTAPVDEWVCQATSQITMFSMHANCNVHANWAMGTTVPGHPLICAWRKELATIYNQFGTEEVPNLYIERAFVNYPALNNLWYSPRPPPLPYLWVYLALQVVLQREPDLRSTICCLPSQQGPMYRRYLYNIVHDVPDAESVSRLTADDLAKQPMSIRTHDRWFVKLVGADRSPVETHLKNGSFVAGSALDFLSRLPIRLQRQTSDLRKLSSRRSVCHQHTQSQQERRCSLSSRCLAAESIRRSSTVSVA